MADADAIEAARLALEKLLEELGALVLATAEGAKPVDLGQPIGRISRVDAMQQQGMQAENRRAAQMRRQQVQAALARIEAGDYGECLGCGEEIEPRRLVAQPEAPLCVECQGRREARG